MPCHINRCLEEISLTVGVSEHVLEKMIFKLIPEDELASQFRRKWYSQQMTNVCEVQELGRTK